MTTDMKACLVVVAAVALMALDGGRLTGNDGEATSRCDKFNRHQRS